MELGDYLRILKRRGWLIILLAVLTAGAAFGLRHRRPSGGHRRGSDHGAARLRPDAGDPRSALDFAVWLNSSLRAAEVIDALQLDMTPGELMGDVTIAPSTSESVIQIDVENSDPDLAKTSPVSGPEQLKWNGGCAMPTSVSKTVFMPSCWTSRLSPSSPAAD